MFFIIQIIISLNIISKNLERIYWIQERDLWDRTSILKLSAFTHIMPHA